MLRASAEASLKSSIGLDCISLGSTPTSSHERRMRADFSKIMSFTSLEPSFRYRHLFVHRGPILNVTCLSTDLRLLTRMLEARLCLPGSSSTCSS